MRINVGRLTIPAGGGVTLSLDLPPTHFLKSLSCEVSIVCTNTGAVTYFEDALSRLLTSIRYYVGSSPDLDMPGRTFRHFFDTVHGYAAPYTELAGTADVAVTGTWTLLLPRSDPSLLNPDLTADDMRLGANPRIEFVIGAITQATAGTAVITSGTITIYADVAEVAADMPRVLANPKRLHRAFPITDLPTTPNQEPRRLTPGRFVRFVGYQVTNRATPFARSDARVTFMEQEVNEMRRGRASWTTLQAQNGSRFKLATLRSGFMIHDGDPNLRLDPRTMFDLRGARSVKTVIDGDATAADIQVVQEEILFPSRAALAAVRAALKKRAA